MASCPACGADGSGRFCGTCGLLLQPRNQTSRPTPADAPDGGLIDLGPETPADLVEDDRSTAERPVEDSGRPRTRAVVVIGLVGVLVAGLLVWLQPDPEVVSAGRWRGDGTGTTSNRAALPEQVIWSQPRLGAESFERFREEHPRLLGVHGHLSLALASGYVVAVDTRDGSITWERYVGWQLPLLRGELLLVRSGRGVATWDAATGAEVGWFETRNVPGAILATGDDTVALTLPGPDGGETVITDRRGTELASFDATYVHEWSTADGPRMVLVDGLLQRMWEIDLETGATRSSVTLRSETIHGASRSWVLLGDNVGSGVALVDLDGGQRIELPLDVIHDASIVHADAHQVVVFGNAPAVRSPPRGNGQAVQVDLRTGDVDVIELEAGFGQAIASRPAGVLVRSGSLLRLVEVTDTGTVTRWEESIDPTLPVALVGDHVGQAGPDRWRAWNADTGALRYDVRPSDLPRPNRRDEVRSQPYLGADGFVIDAADTLTQIIDPVDGQRISVRRGVHLVSTEQGDLIDRRGTIALIGPDGADRWEVTPGDGAARDSVTVAGDTVVVTDADPEGGVTLRTYGLSDGAPGPVVALPVSWAGILHRLTDRSVVLVGDGATVVDLEPDGPTVRWHASEVIDRDATPIQRGDVLALVGRSSITELDVQTGAVVAERRLPRIIHAIVAYGGNTAFGTAGSDVIAFELDGRERWTADVGARVTAAPTLAGDRIYVGTEDGHIVVLSRDGAVVARLDTGFGGQPVVGAPTVASGLIYAFADRGRRIVALGTP